MRTRGTGTRRLAMVGMVVTLPLGGCITLQLPEPQSRSSAADRYLQVRDSIAGLGEGSDELAAGTPRIRLQPSTMLTSSRYVDATFRVSEDAYVIVVAVDLDHRVRVVFPASPDESGFVGASRPQRVARFFAGFASPGVASFSRFERGYDRISRFGGGGGVFLAVASDRPLQLDRLAPGGEWDEQALERLVFEVSPTSAAGALGRALSLTGQAFSTDVAGFFGRGAYGPYSVASYAQFGLYGSCDSFGQDLYGGTSSRQVSAAGGFAGFVQIGYTRYARYLVPTGGCGAFRTIDLPVGAVNQGPPTVPPRVPRDSTKGRIFPRPGVDSGGRHIFPRTEAVPEQPTMTRVAGLRFRHHEREERDAAPTGWMRHERASDDPRWSAPHECTVPAQQTQPERSQPRADPPSREPRHEVPPQPRQEPSTWTPPAAPAAPPSSTPERAEKSPQR